ALAGAERRGLEMDIDLPALSRIARQGSGSACRSIYGGFVEWQKGEREDGTDSYAVPIAPKNHWDLRIAAVVLTAKEKDVSSRVGMKRTVDTSVLYDGWLQSISIDLRDIKKTITEKDNEKLVEIS